MSDRDAVYREVHGQIHEFVVTHGHPDALVVEIADLLTAQPAAAAPASEHVMWLLRQAHILDEIAEVYPERADHARAEAEKLRKIAQSVAADDGEDRS
nr:hypothetical protein [Kibdelosporangium sp. MJ126-NF4]CEL14014.1 hypothetical protein [Kibdelosporangium sp. MJ126-NF4]CTQ88381.1 hypothetical protein [Kibdelosporangium sp. MJ126-NF4]